MPAPPLGFRQAPVRRSWALLRVAAAARTSLTGSTRHPPRMEWLLGCQLGPSAHTAAVRTLESVSAARVLSRAGTANRSQTSPRTTATLKRDGGFDPGDVHRGEAQRSCCRTRPTPRRPPVQHRGPGLTRGGFELTPGLKRWRLPAAARVRLLRGSTTACPRHGTCATCLAS